MAQRILIADDSEEIIEILQILLTGEGYEVVTAGDGEEAVMLADDTIDLIILDVMMPVKSGYVACSEIRKKSMAPILFLTARTQDSDKSMGFSAGGDDYLAKPFPIRSFFPGANRFCGGISSTRERASPRRTTVWCWGTFPWIRTRGP